MRKAMAFQTLAELMIIILVLSVVVILVTTQFAGLGRQANELSQGAGSSVNSSLNAQGAALCSVAGGECREQCEAGYATVDQRGGCPQGFYCCKK